MPHPSNIISSFKQAKSICTRGNTTVKNQKSCAQVDPKVIPQMVLPRGRASAEPKQNGQPKRASPMSIRFSEAEREIVGTKARAVGCSVNAYVRAATLGSRYKPPYDPALRQAILLLNRELTAHGNNLNQIAKRLNSDPTTPTHETARLNGLATALLRTLAAVRNTLSLGTGRTYL